MGEWSLTVLEEKRREWLGMVQNFQNYNEATASISSVLCFQNAKLRPSEAQLFVWKYAGGMDTDGLRTPFLGMFIHISTGTATSPRVQRAECVRVCMCEFAYVYM